MDAKPLIPLLEEGLAEIPLMDIHTHLDAAHLSARGLHDVLLYHMIISDLGSAGCPSQARLSEDCDDGEARVRLVEAVPFVPHIRNTSGFWGVRIILRDLYGIEEIPTSDTWEHIHRTIAERAGDRSWPREILRRAGVRRAGTELWRRRDGSADDIFQYALEWAFFTRAQWGVNDIPLYELERAWNQPGPGAPLPVTLGDLRPALTRTIHTLDDLHAAILHYVERIPYGEVLSTAQHISTDLNLRSVSETEMAAALAPIAAAHGAVVTTLDVDADPALEDAWGELVPVLLLGSAAGGVELCRYRLDPDRVRAALTGAADTAPGA